MIIAYVPADGTLKAELLDGQTPLPPSAVWIDLVSPSEQDEAAVESVVGIEVPTREKMVEIEPSSRLYIQNGARYMTAALLCGTDTDNPSVVAVTFILAGHRLITVRYAEPRAFPAVAGHFARLCPFDVTGEMVLVEMLEAIVDRGADVLEQIGTDVESMSRSIFDQTPDPENANTRYRAILSQIGHKEGLVSSARESLASLQRLLSFLSTDVNGCTITKESRASVKSMGRDVAGLADYTAFINDKLQFLLDATIGMVGLEQNNIIKIFAVLSVVLMPPTLIASIYGMNFAHMPELHWTYAYPLTLGMMVVSGILPYVFFKWRGWL